MSMKLTAFSYNNECMQGKYIAKYFMDDDEIERNAIDGKGKETEEEKKEEPPYVGFISLFRYSSGFDKILVIFSTIIAVVSGASIPAVLIVFGTVIDKLIVYDVGTKNTTNQSMTTEQFLHETSKLCTINAIFGFVFVFCNYVMISFFSIAAANQAFKIRCLFMKSVLKQDIAWYDTNETGDFASRITSDLTKVQDGIAEKLGICISFVSSTILCTGTGLYYSWKLALVVISISPVKAISMAFMTKMQATVAKEEMQAYGTAGAVAEEVLSSIRTVVSFGGERKEIQRYDNCLIPARKKGIKRGLITAISSCITWITISAGYALAFWYGIKLILAGSLTGGSLVIVFFNVMSASTFIGQTAPYFEAFATARGAAAKIFSIIDRQPLIDSSSEKGMKPESVNGTINIRDVHFKYPARPTVPVLKGVSLDVHPGETVALVGPSGCGKSTIIQLILRFYDTNDGAVELDGNNVSDLNVGWLRDHIGLVGQEPVLFSTTIAENIRYGKRDASDEEIENAAKVANAHEFIQALPLKYDTLVGERGIQLSGGQKQRIAIARALIKNPKILLLDEATSALDTESESVVQAALDKARQGRTTIVVAHRLSTIRTADKIIVLSDGEVKEVGTHENLMNNEGIYYNLVQTQTKPTDAEKQDDINDKEGYIPSLNSGSIGFANGSTGAVQKQISSESIIGEHQVSAKPAYNRQSSKLSAYGNQLSTNSAEKDVLKTEDDEDEIDKSASVPQTRLWKTSAQDWPYALIGAISAILMGLHFPVYGIIFGSILGLLSGTTSEISEQANTYCIVFALMAISSGLCSFLQAFMFSIAGEKLTSKLRKMVFANIITQDIEFFDNPKNSVGSLCSRLTSDASSVQGAAGSRMSTLLQASSTVVASIILAMWFNYKIGLVVLSIIPIAMLGAYFEGIVITGASINEIKGAEDASKVAIEAIESIRTVASLHQEETFFIKFQNFLLGPHKKSRRQSHVRGLIFGLAQGLTAFSYAACMYYGSVLVANKELHYANLMKVLEGVLLSAMMLGQAVAFAPDYQRGKFAAVRIFKLLDLKPKIDAFSNNGRVLNNVNGYIRFKNVHFIYSSRPKVKILNGLDLEIEPGKTVALVGSSGCGKSTCVQLIERFYDTQHGSVVIDDEDVKEMNVSNLRSHIGLVSQEPILFSYSIADNIAYGDNSKKVEMNEIIAAARQANIHNFIITLPQGYHTPVGNKGTHLSGGQKQRVAIARALLRNPKILLLDEATSALDAESEKIVQDALDKARSGRTCLIIAHRLSTVQNADAIMVIHEGKIVEQGTHQELLNKKGHYYNLHNVQSSTE